MAIGNAISKEAISLERGINVSQTWKGSAGHFKFETWQKHSILLVALTLL